MSESHHSSQAVFLGAPDRSEGLTNNCLRALIRHIFECFRALIRETFDAAVDVSETTLTLRRLIGADTLSFEIKQVAESVVEEETKDADKAVHSLPLDIEKSLSTDISKGNSRKDDAETGPDIVSHTSESSRKSKTPLSFDHNIDSTLLDRHDDLKEAGNSNVSASTAATEVTNSASISLRT